MLHQPPLRGWVQRPPNPVSSGWARGGRQGTRRSSRQLLQHDERRPRKYCVRTSAAARARETPTAGRSPPIIDRSRGMSGNRISAKGVEITLFPTAKSRGETRLPGCPVSRPPDTAILDRPRPSQVIVLHRPPSSVLVFRRPSSSSIVHHRPPSSIIVSHRPSSSPIVCSRLPSSFIVPHRPSSSVIVRPFAT